MASADYSRRLDLSYRHMFVCFEYEDWSWMDVSGEEPLILVYPLWHNALTMAVSHSVAACGDLWGYFQFSVGTSKFIFNVSLNSVIIVNVLWLHLSFPVSVYGPDY